MAKPLKKINKLSASSAIIISSIILGGFYLASQINKQNSIEKQQQVEIENEKDSLEGLNDCLNKTKDNYLIKWNELCKDEGLLSEECISLVNKTHEEYKEEFSEKDESQKLLKKLEFEEKQKGCSCKLPSKRADWINRALKERKEECFKQYPQK